MRTEFHKKLYTEYNPTDLPGYVFEDIPVGFQALYPHSDGYWYNRVNGGTAYQLARSENHYLKTQVDQFFSGEVPITGYEKSNWDYAYANTIVNTGFNSLTGNLTLIQNDAGVLTRNLDGRYSYLGHTHTTSEITNLSSYTGFDARYFTETEADARFEPIYAAGTTAQYYRGDKSWQTLDTSVVPEGSNLYYTNSRADARITLQKAVALGLATLDASGKIPTSQLPALAITDTFVVSSQAAMLALTAETGDIAVRTDLNKSFILKGTSPSTLGDWTELLTPTDTVLSVNGQTGVVTLTTTHISEGTNLYYLDSRARAAISSSATGLTYTPATGVVSFTSGYSIPTTASQTNWNTAYGWGNHASAGYLTSESDTLATVTARGSTTTQNVTIQGAGSGYLRLYSAYSGSPSNVGFEIANYSGTVTFQHNANGGSTVMGGYLAISGNIRSSMDGEFMYNLPSTVGAAQYQAWYNSAGTRRGYFGFPSGYDDSFVLNNETGGHNIYYGSYHSFNSKVYSPNFESTVATGTAPLIVASTTLVTNLNAQYLNGYDGSTSAAVNTVALRDSNGYLKAVYLADTNTDVLTTTNTITSMYASKADGYLYKWDAASVKVFLGLSSSITGSGSNNQMVKFTSSGTVGNGSMSDDGSYIYNNGVPLYLTGAQALRLAGVLGSPTYIRLDTTANGGKSWRFGHTGAITATSWDIYNETDNIVPFSVEGNGAATFSSTLQSGHITSTAGLTIGASNNISWGGLYGAGIATLTADSTNGFQFYPTGSTAGMLVQITAAGNINTVNSAAQVTTTYAGVTVSRFFTDTGGGVISVDGGNNFSLRYGGASGTNWVTMYGSTGTVSFTSNVVVGSSLYLSTGNYIQFDAGSTNNYNIRKSGTSMYYTSVGTHEFSTAVNVTGALATSSTVTGSELIMNPSVNFGLRLWFDATGYAYIDSKYNSAGSGRLYLRTRTAGTPVNALWFLGTGEATFASTITSLTHTITGDLNVSGYIYDTNNSQILAGADAGGFYFAAGATSPALPIYIGGTNTTYTAILGGKFFVGATTGYTKLDVVNGHINSTATYGFGLGMTSILTGGAAGWYHTNGLTTGYSYMYAGLGGFRIGVEGKSNVIDIVKTTGATTISANTTIVGTLTNTGYLDIDSGGGVSSIKQGGLTIFEYNDPASSYYLPMLATGSGTQYVTIDASGVLSYTAGTSGVTGSGTTGQLPKFTGSTALGNSYFYDDGTYGMIKTAGSATQFVEQFQVYNPSSSASATSSIKFFTDYGATKRAYGSIDFGYTASNTAGILYLQTKNNATTLITALAINSYEAYLYSTYLQVDSTSVHFNGDVEFYGNEVYFTSGTAIRDGSGTTGSAGQVLSSNGTGSVVWINPVTGTGTSSGAAGYIQFSDGIGGFSSSSNIFWDNSNVRLGLGTATPAYSVHVSGSNKYIYATDGTNFAALRSTGILYLSRGGNTLTIDNQFGGTGTIISLDAAGSTTSMNFKIAAAAIFNMNAAGLQMASGTIMDVDGLRTADAPFASGPGIWRFGKMLSGAYTSDTNDVLEMEVDGHVYYVRAVNI